MEVADEMKQVRSLVGGMRCGADGEVDGKGSCCSTAALDEMDA